MKVINKTLEVPRYVVSEDGTMHRYLSSNPTEAEVAEAKKDIAEYEKSVKGVLFTRLVQRGVLSEIKTARPAKEGETLTPEQELHNQAIFLLDGVMDDGCERADYYLFTPKTEDDIKDLCVWYNLQYQYSDIILKNPDPDKLSRYVHTCEVGKTYIYISNVDCEYGNLVNPEAFVKSVAKMADVFEKLGKAQRKAN